MHEYLPYPWSSQPIISPNAPGRLGKSGALECAFPTTMLFDTEATGEPWTLSVFGGSCGGAEAVAGDGVDMLGC